MKASLIAYFAVFDIFSLLAKLNSSLPDIVGAKLTLKFFASGVENKPIAALASNPLDEASDPRLIKAGFR